MGLVKRQSNAPAIKPITHPFYGDYPLKNIVDAESYRVSPSDIQTSESYYNLQTTQYSITKILYNKGGALLRSTPLINTASPIRSNGRVNVGKYIFVFEQSRCSIYSLTGVLVKTFTVSDITILPDAASSSGLFHLQNNSIMLYRSNGNAITAMTMNGVLIGSVPWTYYSTRMYEISKEEVLIARQSSGTGWEYFLYSISNNQFKLLKNENYSANVGLGSYEAFMKKKEGGLY